MDQDENQTIEQRLEHVTNTAENFKDAAGVLGVALLTEKKWRKWFVGIAVVLGIGLLCVGTLTVVFITKFQTVADRIDEQSVSNFKAIQSNQKVLDQIQACNDPLSECSKERDALIKFAQDGIKTDLHEQIASLRQDFQSLLSQLQRGETIVSAAKSLEVSPQSQTLIPAQSVPQQGPVSIQTEPITQTTNPKLLCDLTLRLVC